MASAPTEPPPILGRVDAAGHLIAADPELAALQVEAGSHVGARLALPQVAAIVRLAHKLGIPVARRVIAAGAEQDVDLWVRAVPEGQEVALAIDKWTFRPAAPQRLAALIPSEHDPELEVSRRSWRADDKLQLLSLSPGLAEMLGIDVSEAVGRPLISLFRLEEDEGGDFPILAALSSRSDFAGQRARPRLAGDALVLLSGKAVHTPDGCFAGYSGEAVVPEAQEEASGASPVAIDESLKSALRSPLDRIIASADLIAHRSEGPLRDDYADYAADISAAARHLLAVIRSMGGQAPSEQDRVNLAMLASEAVMLLETAADDRSVIIALEPSAPLMARGEPSGVTQILVNVIGNALRHSPEGGTVTVSFDHSEGFVGVNVSDDGPGIDEADHERIFERFERASRTGSGTGLGLTISRRLARSMGGDIRVQSSPGTGARFTVLLPSA